MTPFFHGLFLALPGATVLDRTRTCTIQDGGAQDCWDEEAARNIPLPHSLGNHCLVKLQVCKFWRRLLSKPSSRKRKWHGHFKSTGKWYCQTEEAHKKWIHITGQPDNTDWIVFILPKSESILILSLYTQHTSSIPFQINLQNIIEPFADGEIEVKTLGQDNKTAQLQN